MRQYMGQTSHGNVPRTPDVKFSRNCLKNVKKKLKITSKKTKKKKKIEERK